MRLFALPLVFAIGCVMPDSQPDQDPQPDPDPQPQPNPQPDPPPPPPPPPAPVCEGAYQVDTVLDVQAAAVLPQTAYDAVDLLRGLRDHPGETLFDLAEDAGVPAVGEIRDALPSALEDRLYGWIDGQLATYTSGDSPVAQVIARILAVAEMVIAELHLSSELTVGAVHRLHEIVFAIDDLEIRQDLDGFSGILDLEETPATTVANQTLTIGNHSFGLPFGELALAALDAVLQAELGTDLRGALGLLVNCPDLAHAVASRCYFGVCVGHETQLAAICEGGLDRLAGEIDERVGAVRFDAIRLQSGTAHMSGADALDGGVWTATIDAGMGPRSAPGTFAGHCE